MIRMTKSYIPKEDDSSRKWYLIDATDLPAGRLAVEIANILRGRVKPSYTPHVDMGDFVVVVNAEKIKLTGAKEEKKIYRHFTGFPSGLRLFPASIVRKKNPTRIITQAVKGMLPKNHLCRHQATRLKVYAGAEHPHAAQQPETIKVL